MKELITKLHYIRWNWDICLFESDVSVSSQLYPVDEIFIHNVLKLLFIREKESSKTAWWYWCGVTAPVAGFRMR